MHDSLRRSLAKPRALRQRDPGLRSCLAATTIDTIMSIASSRCSYAPHLPTVLRAGAFWTFVTTCRHPGLQGRPPTDTLGHPPGPKWRYPANGSPEPRCRRRLTHVWRGPVPSRSGDDVDQVRPSLSMTVLITRPPRPFRCVRTPNTILPGSLRAGPFEHPSSSFRVAREPRRRSRSTSRPASAP